MSWIFNNYGPGKRPERGFRQSAKATDLVDQMREAISEQLKKAELFANEGQPSEPANSGFWEDGVVMVHLGGSLYAPSGWNNYLTTGNFIGCRPIIKAGGRINTYSFETINFEMA
jgi:hypothetical protein